MTEDQKDGKCARRVNRGDDRYPIFESCGRDSVSIDGNGKPVCRIHLAADQREIKRRREWSDKLDRGKALQARAEQLSKELGIEISAHYQALRHPGYTGGMVVPLEWLSEVAKTGCVPPPSGGATATEAHAKSFSEQELRESPMLARMSEGKKERAPYRSKQVYRCQHCGYEGDGWKDGGDVCPKCGGRYDYIEAQDSP